MAVQAFQSFENVPIASAIYLIKTYQGALPLVASALSPQKILNLCIAFLGFVNHLLDFVSLRKHFTSVMKQLGGFISRHSLL